MKEHPDYKYRPRRKPKTLVKSQLPANHQKHIHSHHHHPHLSNNKDSSQTHQSQSHGQHQSTTQVQHLSPKYPFPSSLELTLGIPRSKFQPNVSSKQTEIEKKNNIQTNPRKSWPFKRTVSCPLHFKLNVIELIEWPATFNWEANFNGNVWHFSLRPLFSLSSATPTFPLSSHYQLPATPLDTTLALDLQARLQQMYGSLYPPW